MVLLTTYHFIMDQIISEPFYWFEYLSTCWGVGLHNAQINSETISEIAFKLSYDLVFSRYLFNSYTINIRYLKNIFCKKKKKKNNKCKFRKYFTANFAKFLARKLVHSRQPTFQFEMKNMKKTLHFFARYWNQM